MATRAAITWLFMVLSCLAVANELPVTDLSKQNEQKVSPTLACTDTLTNKASFADALASPASDWVQQRQSVVYDYMPINPRWCHLRVVHDGKRRWLLALESALLHEVDVYVSAGGDTVSFNTGTQYRHSQRPVNERHFFFPMPDKGAQIQDVYIRVMGLTFYAPVRFVTEAEMVLHQSHQMALGSVVAGMMLSLVAALLLTRTMSVERRRPLRLLGASLMVIYLMLLTVIQGYGFMEFWPDSVRWNNAAIDVFLILCFVNLWFYLGFLHQQHSRLWQAILIVTLTVVVVLSIWYLFSGNMFLVRTTHLINFIGGFLFLGRVVWLYFNVRSKTEYLLWLGWIFSFSGTILQTFGVVNFHFDLDIMYTVNFAFLITLFSWDIYTMIRENQKKLVYALENTVAREAEISILQRQRANELEEQVKDRTKALANSMKDLHMINVKLRAASSTDALTGVMNRLACDQYIESTWQQGQDFSIAFVDADYFKRINDNYGHDVGDVCLQFLATCLTNSVSHPKVRVARFGGEEFVMIAPGIKAETLFENMEAVRKNIAESSIEQQGLDIKLTVSIGISSAFIDDKVTPKMLVKQADLAVYQAKDAGRNRTVVFHP